MNTRGRSNTTKSAVKPILTAGEVFDDGAIIELVRGPASSTKPDLLLWRGSEATIGPQVKYLGRVYESLEIAPSVSRAVLFPTGCENCEPLRALYGELASLFRNLNLPMVIRDCWPRFA